MIRSQGEKFKSQESVEAVAWGVLTHVLWALRLSPGRARRPALSTDILHSLWPVVTVNDGRRHCTINLGSGSVSEKHSNVGIRDDDWSFMPRGEEALGPQHWGKHTGSWNDSESVWTLHILILHSAVTQRCDKGKWIWLLPHHTCNYL